MPASELGAIDRSPPRPVPLAVEDLDSGPIAEVALFHLLNAAATGPGLLLTARTPPEAWRVGLPDLGSRLRAATRVTMTEADDDLLRRVVVKLFADGKSASIPVCSIICSPAWNARSRRQIASSRRSTGRRSPSVAR